MSWFSKSVTKLSVDPRYSSQSKPISVHRFVPKMMPILLSGTHGSVLRPCLRPKLCRHLCIMHTVQAINTILPAARRNRVERTVLLTRRPSPSVSSMTCSHQKHDSLALKARDSTRLTHMDSVHHGASPKFVTLCARIEMTIGNDSALSPGGVSPHHCPPHVCGSPVACLTQRRLHHMHCRGEPTINSSSLKSLRVVAEASPCTLK